MNLKKKNIFISIIRIFIYLFIYLLDFTIWVTLQVIPSRYSFNLAKFKIRPIPLLHKLRKKIVFRNIIRNYLRKKQNNVFFGSSCLSLTLTGKILCDLLALKTEIHIGMMVNSDNEKVPHSWLIDPKDKTEITCKIVKGTIDIVELYKI